MFQFVDRILAMEPGKSALGVSHVGHGSLFTRQGANEARTIVPSIIGEALGQLAAWSAMKANGFSRRPVAGIVGEVTVPSPAITGKTLLLQADIHTLSEESVSYDAVATLDGNEVLAIRNGLGPFLPMEELNDPIEVQTHFDKIYQPGSFDQVVDPETDSSTGKEPLVFGFDKIVDRPAENEIVAEKSVPETWMVFDEHFPRMPVLPLSLLLEDLLAFASQWDGIQSLQPKRIYRVKMSNFVRPGTTIRARVRLENRTATEANFLFRCEVDGDRVCVARAEFGMTEGDSNHAT